LKKYFNFVNDSALRQNESHGDLNPYYIIILWYVDYNKLNLDRPYKCLVMLDQTKYNLKCKFNSNHHWVSVKSKWRKLGSKVIKRLKSTVNLNEISIDE